MSSVKSLPPRVNTPSFKIRDLWFSLSRCVTDCGICTIPSVLLGLCWGNTNYGFTAAPRPSEYVGSSLHTLCHLWIWTALSVVNTEVCFILSYLPRHTNFLVQTNLQKVSLPCKSKTLSLSCKYFAIRKWSTWIRIRKRKEDTINRYFLYTKNWQPWLTQTCSHTDSPDCYRRGEERLWKLFSFLLFLIKCEKAQPNWRRREACIN